MSEQAIAKKIILMEAWEGADDNAPQPSWVQDYIKSALRTKRVIAPLFIKSVVNTFEETNKRG